MKDKSFVFVLAQIFILWTKRTHRSEIVRLEWLDENSPNCLCHFWNYKSVFLWTLHHASVSWEITLLYVFSWNCTWFGQKEPIKVQNFRLSTAPVKSHLICCLMLGLMTLNNDTKYEEFGEFEFGEIWPAHSKVGGKVIFHDTKKWGKI